MKRATKYLNQQKEKSRLREYYMEHSWTVVKLYERSYFLSIVLLLVKHFLNFSLSITQNIQDELAIHQEDTSYLSNIIFFFGKYNIKLGCLFISLGINVILIVLVLVQMVMFLLQKERQDKDIQNTETKYSRVSVLVSLLFQVYYYTVFIVSALSSLCLVDDYLIIAVINLILTTIIRIHDYDQRFTQEDYLSCRIQWLQNIQIPFDIFTMVAYVHFPSSILMVYNLIKYSLFFSLNLFFVPYHSHNIQFLNSWLYLMNVAQALNVFLSIQTNFWHIYNFGMLLSIPLAFGITKNLTHFRLKVLIDSYTHKFSNTKNNSYEKSSKNLDLSQREMINIDIYIRSIFSMTKLSYDQYLSSNSSIFLEQIISQHNTGCTLYPYCFCANKTVTHEERESDTLRKQYLYSYIENIFNRVSGAKKNTISQLTYSQLTFAIDILQNETKALTLAIGILSSTEEYLSLQEEQHIRNIIKYIKRKVKTINPHVEIKGNAIKSIKDQNRLNFIQNIYFDEDIVKSYVLINQCLELKKIMLAKIGLNHVDLEQVYYITRMLYKKRNQLYDLFSEMITVCHTCFMLAFVVEIFEESILYNTPLSKRIDKITKLNNGRSVINHSEKALYSYQDDSCVIFITLLNKVGIVQRASKNLFDVVPIYRPEEVIGKNINYMMPQGISSMHDKILENFINNQNITQTIKSYSLLIGLDQNGWAIPYEMKLQTSLIGLSDFGVCAWVKQINDGTLYLMADMDNQFQIQASSKAIYNQFFSNIMKKHSLNQVQLTSLMPTLSAFLKKQNNHQLYYETIIIKPKSEFFCYSEGNFEESDNFVNNLLSMDLYKISAEFYQLDSKYTKTLQMKVFQLQRIEEYHLKVEVLKVLMNDFELLELYNLEFIEKQKLILAERSSEISDQEINSFGFNQFDERHSLSKSKQNSNGSIDQSIGRISNDAKLTNRNYERKPSLFNRQSELESQSKVIALFPVSINDTNDFQNHHKEEVTQLYAKQRDEDISNKSNIPLYFPKQNHKNSSDLANQSETFYSSTLQQINQKRDSNSTMQPLSPSKMQIHSPLNTNTSRPYDGLIPLNSAGASEYLIVEQPLSPKNYNEIISFNSFQGEQVGLNALKMTSNHSLQQKSSGRKRRIKLQTLLKQRDNATSYSHNNSQRQIDSQQITSQYQSQYNSNVYSNEKFENTGRKKSKSQRQQMIQNQKDAIFSNLQDGSVQTSKTGSSAKKKEMMNMLRKPTRIIGLIIIKYLGIVALLIMVIMNLVGFFTTNNNLLQQRDDYQNIDWSTKIKKTTSQLTEFQSIIQIFVSGLLPNSGKGYPNLVTDAAASQIKSYDIYQTLILQYYNTKWTSGSYLYNILSEQYMDFAFMYSYTTNQTLHVKFAYAQVLIYAFNYKLAYQHDADGMDEIQIISNYQTMSTKLDYIDTEVKAAVDTQYQSMKNSANLYLILDSVISMVFSLSFLPIFAYIQRLREKIIKLYTTFGPDKLQYMLLMIISSEELLRKEIKSELNTQQNQLNQQQHSTNQLADHPKVKLEFSLAGQPPSLIIQKKKNISTTTTLNVFKIRIFLYGVIFLICNIIYSIAIGIYQTSFLNTLSANRTFTDSVNEMSQYLSEVAGMRAILIVVRFTSGVSTDYSSYLTLAKSQIDEMTDQLNSFYTTMAEQQEASHFDSGAFNDFIINILQNDACKVVNENQQYLSSTGFNITECYGVKQNIFSSGIIAATKYFLSIVESQFFIFEEDLTSSEFLYGMNNLYTDYNLGDQYYYKIYYNYILDAIDGFMKQTTRDQYNYFITYNIIFIAIQLASFVIASQLIYLRFYSSIFHRLLKTKQGLELIDIDLLQENQYVISYFKSQR